MSEPVEDLVVPELGDVPEDDTAEPDGAEVQHTASPEEVAT